MRLRSKKNKNKIIIALVLFLIFLPVTFCKAYAAEASVTFGSQGYTAHVGKEFKIGVYIKSDAPIMAYDITLIYDAEKVEYVSGAILINGGMLKLQGNASGNEIKHMLVFKVLAEGSTAIGVSDATITVAGIFDGNAVLEVASNTILATAPLLLSSVEYTLADCQLKSLSVNQISVENFMPDKYRYELRVAHEIEKVEVDAQPIKKEASVSVTNTALLTGSNTIVVSVKINQELYRDYILLVEREEVTEKTEESEAIEESKAIEEDETAEVISTPPPIQVTEGILPEAVAEMEVNKEKSKLPEEGSVLITLGIILLFIILILIMLLVLIQRRKTKKAQNSKEEKEAEDGKQVEESLEKNIIRLDKNRRENKSPIIEIEGLSMRFLISQTNASSLKEYIIAGIKGKNTYRALYALNDVSFTVYPGEIIGIIGTNGSGKSTLLRLIAGAMKPLEGSISVDSSKVQLLTLGTGFDSELTARENVYLNGAIIGYSKEYIEEKFEDIVAFAELDGFMEEKVKNFSSGMVARLGFAIATARETPEILILDEVLSVGDMFFRKKSEKQIREMIQSGSTVLIVSHSTETILSNCTRVVWIEQGKLQMEGDPKEVCQAYQRMNEAVNKSES